MQRNAHLRDCCKACDHPREDHWWQTPKTQPILRCEACESEGRSCRVSYVDKTILPPSGAVLCTTLNPEEAVA